jgi:hypothetical protein
MLEVSVIWEMYLIVHQRQRRHYNKNNCSRSTKRQGLERKAFPGAGAAFDEDVATSKHCLYDVLLPRTRFNPPFLLDPIEMLFGFGRKRLTEVWFNKSPTSSGGPGRSSSWGHL